MTRVQRALFSGVAGAALCAWSCGAADSREPVETAQPVIVRTVETRPQPITATFEVGGVIRAATTAQLTSRVMAEVREINVAPGDFVKKGHAVVLLDDRDLTANRARAVASLAAARSGAAAADAQRAAAESGLARARSQHGRMQQLFERRSATPAEMDEAVAQLGMAEGSARAAAARVQEATSAVAAAQAAADAAAVAASFSTIVAPFNGRVTEKHIEVGNMASPGAPLVTIESTEGFRFEFQADERRIRSLRAGDVVHVRVDGDEAAPTTGTVSEIAHAVDPSVRTFTVKVALPEQALSVRSGAFARALVPGESRTGLAIPLDAIVRRGQLTTVFVVDRESRARMRAVATAPAGGDRVEVLAGVASGEAVVVDPPPTLVDGARVRATAGER